MKTISEIIDSDPELKSWKEVKKVKRTDPISEARQEAAIICECFYYYLKSYWHQLTPEEQRRAYLYKQKSEEYFERFCLCLQEDKDDDIIKKISSSYHNRRPELRCQDDGHDDIATYVSDVMRRNKDFGRLEIPDNLVVIFINFEKETNKPAITKKGLLSLDNHYIEIYNKIIEEELQKGE